MEKVCLHGFSYEGREMNEVQRKKSVMDYSTLFLLVSFVWAVLHLLSFARRKLPPGPFPLPIIGNLFQLGNKPHESLAKLSKTYGPLMAIKLGSMTTIVVSSADMAQQVLQKQDESFSGRTVPDSVCGHIQGKTSLGFIPPSHHWRNLRKLYANQMFTTQKLNGSEGIRHAKLKDLLDYIREISKSGHAINIGQVVFATTLNMISSTMFSIDLASFNSESEEDFKTIVSGVMHYVGKPNLSDYFPLLRPFDLHGTRRRVASYFYKLDKVFDKIIDQRLQSKEHDASNDLLNGVLHHIQEDGLKLTRIDILSLLKDLFVAGIDTSAGTLEWAMSELLRNPDILGKAKLELKENINKNKPVEESDITRLPYLQAIVKETLRMHPPAPFLIPRRAETDIEISGFTVPKHAQVLVNAWDIGRDPKLWVNPTSFMPDRFLGSNVDFRGRDFKFIPFGAGRRICPGLPLAYRMVHLILASLVHSFDWKLEDDMKPEDINMEAKFGLTLQKAMPLFIIPIEA